MVDTTKIADGIDGLADRQIKAGGMKLTAGSILAIFAFPIYNWIWPIWRFTDVAKDRGAGWFRHICISQSKWNVMDAKYRHI